MKADQWGFRTINLLIASTASGLLWALFHEYVNDLLFLIPLYWIMHVRSNTSRLREINSRMKVAVEVIAELVEDPENLYYQYETALEKNGFYSEAEKWNEAHDEISRT